MLFHLETNATEKRQQRWPSCTTPYSSAENWCPSISLKRWLCLWLWRTHYLRSHHWSIILVNDALMEFPDHVLIRRCFSSSTSLPAWLPASHNPQDWRRYCWEAHRSSVMKPAASPVAAVTLSRCNAWQRISVFLLCLPCRVQTQTLYCYWL